MSKHCGFLNDFGKRSRTFARRLKDEANKKLSKQMRIANKAQIEKEKPQEVLRVPQSPRIDDSGVKLGKTEVKREGRERGKGKRDQRSRGKRR